MRPPRPAILLDRDGTLIVERHYLHDPAGVELETGVVDGLRRLAGTAMPLVVVTNQSGIGRGYFDHAAVDAVNARMIALLAKQGIGIDGVYVCPHRPEDECDCRKPRPGLAMRAAHDLDLDLAGSWVIGDKRADLLLADAIGARGIFVLTGHGAADRDWAIAAGRFVAADMAEAAGIVLRSVAPAEASVR